MSIESALAELTAAVVANTAVLEKLEAGREAALEQLQNKDAGGTKTTRTRRPKETTENADNSGNAGAGSADTGSQAGAAANASDQAAPGVTEDDLRAEATAYIKGAGENVEDRKARAANIKSITDNFGTAALAGDNGIKDPEQRAQALFYLKRFAAGQTVDFSAEYDFAGDPAQGVSGGADSEFDGIG
jgi:hypothetical protein